jgi:carbon storage regulator
MLVVARKQHEFIQIGEDIVVKVIKTSRGSVKIGIDAPDGLRVLRGELSLEDLGLELAPKARSKRDVMKANSNAATMKPVGAV